MCFIAIRVADFVSTWIFAVNMNYQIPQLGLNQRFTSSKKKEHKSFDEINVEKTLIATAAGAAVGIACSLEKKSSPLKSQNASKLLSVGGKTALYTVGATSMLRALKIRIWPDYESHSSDEKNFVKMISEIFIVGMIALMDSKFNDEFRPFRGAIQKLQSKLKSEKINKFLMSAPDGKFAKNTDKFLFAFKIPAYSIGTALVASSLAYIVKNSSLIGSKKTENSVEDATKNLMIKDVAEKQHTERKEHKKDAAPTSKKEMSSEQPVANTPVSDVSDKSSKAVDQPNTTAPSKKP